MQSQLFFEPASHPRAGVLVLPEAFGLGEHAIRANGPDAWIGWPTSPVVEQLYQAWFQAPDPAGRLAIAREMQVQTWQDAPWTLPAPVFPPAVVRGA